MPTNNNTPPENRLTVNIYHRPDTFDNKVDTISAVCELDRSDDIAHCETHVWPATVPYSETTLSLETVSVYDRLEAWASDHDVTIAPPFELRTTTSELRGETRTTLRTPHVCMTLSVDSTLVGAFPYRDGSECYSVYRGLEALQNGRIEDAIPGPFPTSLDDAHHRLCDECGGELLNVQGSTLCHDCGWSDLSESLKPFGPEERSPDQPLVQ